MVVRARSWSCACVRLEKLTLVLVWGLVITRAELAAGAALLLCFGGVLRES